MRTGMAAKGHSNRKKKRFLKQVNFIFKNNEPTFVNLTIAIRNPFNLPKIKNVNTKLPTSVSK